MGQQFEIRIVGIGKSGCDRVAVQGERLFHRCKRLDCIDCRTQDYVQLLRQQGYLLGVGTLTHSYATEREVVDDMLKNTRQKGAF